MTVFLGMKGGLLVAPRPFSANSFASAMAFFPLSWTPLLKWPQMHQGSQRASCTNLTGWSVHHFLHLVSVCSIPRRYFWTSWYTEWKFFHWARFRFFLIRVGTWWLIRYFPCKDWSFARQEHLFWVPILHQAVRKCCFPMMIFRASPIDWWAFWWLRELKPDWELIWELIRVQSFGSEG